MPKEYIETANVLGKVVLKILELVDPKTRNWVHRKKALEYAEKYILKCDILLVILQRRIPIKDEDKRQVETLVNKMRYYRRKFFKYD